MSSACPAATSATESSLLTGSVRSTSGAITAEPRMYPWIPGPPRPPTEEALARPPACRDNLIDFMRPEAVGDFEALGLVLGCVECLDVGHRSEEHTSELQ